MSVSSIHFLHLDHLSLRLHLGLPSCLPNLHCGHQVSEFKVCLGFAISVSDLDPMDSRRTEGDSEQKALRKSRPRKHRCQSPRSFTFETVSFLLQLPVTEPREALLCINCNSKSNHSFCPRKALFSMLELSDCFLSALNKETKL